MTNLTVNFTNAWWLLLLIPAFVLTLISYFKLNKRYRCTRNRIVSMVMHLIVMVLSIALLAGMTVEYFTPNTETEVILLVDSSYTVDDTREDVDNFIKDVVNGCDSMYKLGIVKFGYDQVYAVELTNDMNKVFSTYLSSEDPDTTATDLASALTYAASLFNNPAAARIVVLSDALETDLEAKDVIKEISLMEISVDTVYFPGEEVTSEVQIVEAVQSTSKIEINSPFDMILTVRSTYAGKATITPRDNQEVVGHPVEVDLVEGLNTVNIPYSFAWGGMHVMTYDIAVDEDTVVQNNSYTNYVYIETFSEVLIIESIDKESEALLGILAEELNATVVNIADTDKIPASLDELREFDEVILLNVSDEQLQLHEGFDLMLQEYVSVVGGGLFTICGNTADSTQDNWTANAYTREDMYGSVYQEMLPVEIVEYTPPVGVIIIIDTSGSMLNGGKYESSALYWAMQGAQACLDALTERDHVGIMTLSDYYTEELRLTPRTQRDKIIATIVGMEDAAINGTLLSGGTIYSSALERAGKALAARSDLDKKHIIIVSDGEPSSGDTELYLSKARENAENGITLSVVAIDPTDSAKSRMKKLVEEAGCPAENMHAVSKNDFDELPTVMRKDLETDAIKSVNYETFTPTIVAQNSVTNGIKQDGMPELDGYYGVKLKPNATSVLMGQYTPIYAQWDYGKGRVGTFTCDLNGTWSADFFNPDETEEAGVGAQLINNIIYALFPTENVRASDVEATYTGDNYTTTLSIYTELEEGESIQVSVIAPSGDTQILTGDLTTGFSRMTFAVKEVGLHTIFVQKLDAEGQEICSTTIYKVLSYSKEYDAFADRIAAEELMALLSEQTDGFVISEPWQVFENAVKYLHIVFDPRTLFSILIIALFLIDIAVRKFKWKWPHEIIREKRQKAAMAADK